VYICAKRDCVINNVGLVQSGQHSHHIQLNLFSPWYSCKHFSSVGKQHSLTHSLTHSLMRTNSNCLLQPLMSSNQNKWSGCVSKEVNMWNLNHRWRTQEDGRIPYIIILPNELKYWLIWNISAVTFHQLSKWWLQFGH
jgi:hypothetical protein